MKAVLIILYIALVSLLFLAAYVVAGGIVQKERSKHEKVEEILLQKYQKLMLEKGECKNAAIDLNEMVDNCWSCKKKKKENEQLKTLLLRIGTRN